MATTLYSQMIPTSTAPWRRNPEQLQSNTLSVEAPEFVPSWKKEAAPATPATDGNCFLISLGAYSDDDDSDEEVLQNTPEVKSASIEATSKPKPASNSETFRFRRPWRVTAAEFVPRGSLPSEGQVPNITERRSSEALNTKLPPWRRDAPSLVKASRSPSPCGTTGSDKLAEGTPMSQSTTASSHSGDSASSTSCASRSRSPTPPPVEQGEAEVAPLSISNLLLWRHASACERPETIVTSAKQFERPTAEASHTATEVASPKKDSAPEERCWRNVAPAKKLEVSEDSWAAQQRTRRASIAAADLMSNEEIVRLMKSILNKDSQC